MGDPKTIDARLTAIIRYMQRSIDTPEDPAARLALGASMAKIGGYGFAAEQFEAAQSLAPTGSEVWRQATYRLGRLHEREGRKDDAIREYRRVADVLREAGE